MAAQTLYRPIPKHRAEKLRKLTLAHYDRMIAVVEGVTGDERVENIRWPNGEVPDGESCPLCKYAAVYKKAVQHLVPNRCVYCPITGGTGTNSGCSNTPYYHVTDATTAGALLIALRAEREFLASLDYTKHGRWYFGDEALDGPKH